MYHTYLCINILSAPCLYHVSCFMQSSKQATPWKRQSTIWAYSRSYLTTLISMDTFHNIIRYLLPSPSSSKSLENSILVYNRIYSLCRIWPWTYKNGQMSIILPYPFEVDQFYRYPHQSLPMSLPHTCF